jgi:hypothetical protein
MFYLEMMKAKKAKKRRGRRSTDGCKTSITQTIEILNHIGFPLGIVEPRDRMFGELTPMDRIHNAALDRLFMLTGST